MNMAIIFDTLKFANRLKAAGVKPEIAEAHAEAEAEVFTETLTNQVATKHDILKLESKINNLDSKIEQIKNELIIKLGGTIVAVGALLGALLVIFHT